MKERAFVREVGLHDGLQGRKEILPTAAKLAWLEAEYEAGVREVEIGSFVPAKLSPQLADTDAVLRRSRGLKELKASVLIPNLKGAEKGLALGARAMNFVLCVSDSYNRATLRRSIEESVEELHRVVSRCRNLPADRRPRIACTLATAFGCPLEGAVEEDRVRRIALAAAEAGASEIMLADTAGYGNPAAVDRLFHRVMADVNPIPVRGHFHDGLGLGLANVLAALGAGARAFDASIGGLGGGPAAQGANGNIVSEDLAFMLEAMGLETGIDLGRLLEVREILAANLPRVALRGALARSGIPRNFSARVAASHKE